MEEEKARSQITETGRLLLEEGLVARTWGNISCRIDDDHFAITPSGLSYTETTEEDIAICSLDLSEWSGPRKPSSEKGVHAAAYEIFPEAGFVIHTHQVYATAMAVYMPYEFEITEEETERLGGIGLASYGLPGTKKLKDAVHKVMEEGAHVVLMENHGAVIAGTDRQDALEKVRLLEEICKRNCKGIPSDLAAAPKADRLLYVVQAEYPWAELVQTDAVRARADSGKAIKAQIDDMAQMIGSSVPIVEKHKRNIMQALKNHNAIMIPGVGGLVYGTDQDDSDALALLVTKAAVASNHTDACKVRKRLPAADVKLMNTVYKMKYSKQKHKKQEDTE